MQRKHKILAYSLGGAAILGCTYLYFKQRSEYHKTYEYQMKQFQKQFFNCNIMNLSQMQIQFDQLFILATMPKINATNNNIQDNNVMEQSSFSFSNQNKDIYQIIQSQNNNINDDENGSEINNCCCEKHLKSGATYYECWDCSTVRNEISKSNKKNFESCIYMSMCEDCFDFKKHKGHKYQKYEAANQELFRCNCGDKSFINQSSFCSKHKGFDHLYQQFEDHRKINQTAWDSIEYFFLDQFHALFDTASILLYETLTNKPTKNKLIKEHLNTYLGFIFSKIQEIIDLNPSSLIFFTQIFMKTFKKPIQTVLERYEIRPKVYRQKLKILYRRKINNDLTLFEYILIFTKLFNEQNEKIISQLFRTLIKVNEEFAKFFSYQFYRYIYFLFKVETKSIQGIEKAAVMRASMSPLTHMMIEQVSLYSVFEHLLNTLKEEIFTPFDLLIEYISSKPNDVLENDEVIYLLYNICFEMFKQLNMLNLVLSKYHLLLINKLFSLSIQLFNIHSIKLKIPQQPQQQRQQQQNEQDLFLLNLPQLYRSVHFQHLENQVLTCFINLYEGIAQTAQPLKEQIIQDICKLYQDYAISSSIYLQKIEDSNILFLSLSISFIINLPLLIAVSEGKMFTKNNIKSFFMNKFPLDEDKINKNEIIQNEEQINQKKEENAMGLIKAIDIILNSFITINTKSSYLQQMKLTQRLVNKSSPNGEQLYQIIDLTQSFLMQPSLRINDFFTLTYQLIQLSLDNQTIHGNQDSNGNANQNNNANNSNNSSNNPNIFYQHIQLFKSSRTKQILIFQCVETMYNIAQILLDSTPFINVFTDTLDLYFPDLEENVKLIYKNNMNEILIMLSQSKGLNNSMNIKELSHSTQQILYSNKQIKEFVQEIRQNKQSEDNLEESKNNNNNNNFDENNNKNNDDEDEINLKEEYKEKYYLKNFMRLYDDIKRIVKNQYLNTDVMPNDIYPFIGIYDNNSNNLFQYQIELIQKIILNKNYQKQLMNVISSDSTYHHVSFFFGLQIYLTLSYLEDYKNYKNNKNNIIINDCQEKQNIEEIINMYNDSQFLEQFKKQINYEHNLQKKMLTDDLEKNLLKKIYLLLESINNSESNSE